MTDIKVMLSVLANANMGSPASAWIMHPKNAIAAATLLTATGVQQFPEASQQGRLVGFPIMESPLLDP